MAFEAEETQSSKPSTLLQTTSLPLTSWIRLDVIGLFGIFIVFYFSRLAIFSLSIDDEMEALQASSRVWILTGRWAGYFFDQFLLPQSTVPYLPIALFGVFVSVSYPIVLSAFGVKRLHAVHYLTFPLYAAFPTWTFLAAFAANIASAGVGLFFVACAALQFRQTIEPLVSADVPACYPLHILSGALCLAISVGIYQSFIFAFLSLSLAIVLTVWLSQRFRLSFLLRCAVILASLVMAAIVIYEIADVALRTATNLQDRSYLGNFIDWNTLIQSPLHTAIGVAQSMAHVYGGFSDVYGLNAFAFPLLIVLGLLAIVVPIALTAAQRTMGCVLAFAILCTPFLQHFLAGGSMPVRTLVAAPVVLWFFALAALTTTRSNIAIGAFAVLVVALFQILYSSTLLQAANQFARVHDQNLSAAIYTQIAAAHPDFSTEKTYKVDFFGAKRFDSNYPRPASSTAGFSFFEWGVGDGVRMTNYMRLIGYTNLLPVAADQRQKDRAIFDQMPAWPANGSIRVVDEVTLVKLDSRAPQP